MEVKIYRLISDDYLEHYGVKGMKWGVRRTREELKYNKYSIIASVSRSLSKKISYIDKVRIKGLSEHAADQAVSREVSSSDIVDAITKPLYIENDRLDKKGRPSRRYIGEKATVNINPSTGIITTLWRTGKRKRNKYKKEK